MRCALTLILIVGVRLCLSLLACRFPTHSFHCNSDAHVPSCAVSAFSASVVPPTQLRNYYRP